EGDIENQNYPEITAEVATFDEIKTEDLIVTPSFKTVIPAEKEISDETKEIVPELLSPEVTAQSSVVEEEKTIESETFVEPEMVNETEEPVDIEKISGSVKEIETEKNEEEEDDDEVSRDEHENEFESVYSFQETGAEFLIESKRALFSDALGLGKTVQAVAAIKNLFKNGNITKAIIVCESSEIGSWGQIPGDIDGWLGHFHQRASELKTEAGTGASQERDKQWKNLPEVFITSYDSFFFDLEENAFDIKELKKNTCFIFDEAHIISDSKQYNTAKLSKLNPKYLWVLSSYPQEKLKEKLEKVFKDKLSLKNYLSRRKEEVGRELPGITWQNKWLSLDEEQIEEYNEAFANAKEKVQWFLESGNPLRFNANVFTLLHQLKQVCNFSEKKGKSRKTKLLLEQVNRIAENNQKVVIFSQYDKVGTKKVEDVLTKNNIKFLSYAPGMSTNEMESVLKKFSSSTSITALVAGVKPSRIKIPAGNVSYVIHFDIWWNPASLWQTEEAVIGSSKGEQQNLTVYSYLMKNTIEEKIHALLHKKGFLNKHIIESVNPDNIAEMITNPEWLEIFELPDEEFKQRYQKGLLETEKRIDNYSINEFMERGKNFFVKLGYKNLDATESKTGNSFDVRGLIKKSKYDLQLYARFLMKEVVPESEVKQHLSELKEKAGNGKYFLIT
ncbi:MAG TPA: DEAD/DEAH box helicase, partial [Ignavibacteriaceae bacterium]|nr:DEAD/DEAH box helicase [Ignavibacteriaceae bacterium]